MTDVTVPTDAEEAHERRRRMLLTAFGPAITSALADPTVLEIMVNPDGGSGSTAHPMAGAAIPA